MVSRIVSDPRKSNTVVKMQNPGVNNKLLKFSNLYYIAPSQLIHLTLQNLYCYTNEMGSVYLFFVIESHKTYWTYLTAILYKTGW